MLRKIASFTVPFLLFACGGAPAAEPATPASETPADAPSDTAGAPTDAPEGGTESGWEGEDAAKGAGDAPKEGGEAAPAGDASVKETRTLDVIAKLVKDNRKPVRECYEKARKELPTLQGDLVIHFVLDPEGKVKLAELNQERSTLKSPAVSECAIKVIKGINFPPSSRGMETEANYPFNLMP
jgi:hypothetical protein